MPLPHLFEFMDQAWVPASLRSTLREILECGNALPFRPYYRWVADEVERGTGGGIPYPRGTRRRHGPDHPSHCRETGRRSISLGPVRREPRLRELSHPGGASSRGGDPDVYVGRFSKPGQWNPDTLLFLSATFHHIPPSGRAAVLESLSRSARRVLIFEPLKRSLSSILFVHLSIVPALILPLWYIARPGKLRRFLWCWVLPLAPIMFWWDGIVSCIRQWGEREWQAAADRLGVEMRIISNKSLFSYMIII